MCCKYFFSLFSAFFYIYGGGFFFFEGGVDVEGLYIFAWSNLSLFYDFYFDVMIGKAFPTH